MSRALSAARAAGVVLERVSCAADLPPEWERLRRPEQVGVARPVLAALEVAGVAGVAPRYLVALRGGAVVAGAALHAVQIPLDRQGFPWARDLTRRARDLRRPDLLSFRALFCGLNVSQGRDDVVSGDGPPDPALVLAFAARAEEDAEAEDLDGVVFGHLHPDRLPAFEPLRRHGYVLLPSLAFATLPVRWTSLDGYLGLLRAGYRRQARADLARRDAAGLVVAPALDLAAHADELEPLYRAVVDRAEHRIEVVDAAFFRALARGFPGEAELVGIRRRGRLVAGAVVLRAGDRLSCLEVGYDEALRDEAALYRNLLLAVVERAGALGVRHLDLGQTALDAKARLGAELVPTWLLVHARSAVVAAALRVERAHLRPEPSPARHVFRGPRPESVAPPPLSEAERALADGGDFARHANPELAALLGVFGLDRTYVRGEGMRLWDTEGREILDLVGGYGALPFGHHPAFVWDALLRARDAAVPALAQGTLSAEAGRLARALLEAAPPGLRHAVFASSGAEAVEVAIKAVRAARRRPLVVVAEGGFHGKTLGALSATSSRHFQAPFFAPAPGFVAVPYGDPAALEAVLAARGDEVAAFLVEPIQGEAGVVVPPPGYLPAVRASCDRHGVLLVLDEVQTGLGRTGRLFACEEEGVRPDALTVSKALGGGLVPAAACLVSDAAWTEELALRHSSTFAGNALACAAGVAVLERLRRDDGALLASVRRKGDRLRSRLRELAARHPVLAEVRGRGLLVGLGFGGLEDVDSPILRQLARDHRLVPLLCSYLLHRHGIRVLPPLNGRDALRLLPPLDAPEAALERVADAIEDAVRELQAGDARALARHLVVRGPARPAIARAPATPTPAPAAGASPRWRAPRAPAPGGRFAFLVHPLEVASYRGFEPSLAGADDRELAAMDRLLRDVVDVVEISRVSLRSAAGASCEGWFLGIPLTARALAALPPRASLRWIEAAVREARDRGADVVGLGAYTSIATGGGLRLRAPGVGLTTGNAYTVGVAVEALLRAAAAVGTDPSGARCAVVGAAGSVGRATSLLLASRVRELVLAGNPHGDDARGRLAALAAEIRARAPGTRVTTTLDARAAVADAELVVSATSRVGAVLRPEWLQPGAAVCDVAQPNDVAAAIRGARPDVLVIDGGVVLLPEPIGLGFDFGLPPGHAFACMAETMLLALDGRGREAIPGARLDAERALELLARARRHGFALAGLLRGGRPVADAEIAEVRRRRRAGAYPPTA